MTVLDQLFDREHVLCKIPAGSRKRVLQELSQTLATEDVNEDAMFDALMERERLGSTGLGKGVAIPHCRMACDGMRVALASTERPVDYEASDGELVDLFFALIVPVNENHAHLEALAVLSSVFQESANRDRLRACDSAEGLHEAMQALLRIAAADSSTA